MKPRKMMNGGAAMPPAMPQRPMPPQAMPQRPMPPQAMPQRPMPPQAMPQRPMPPPAMKKGGMAKGKGSGGKTGAEMLKNGRNMAKVMSQRPK